MRRSLILQARTLVEQCGESPEQLDRRDLYLQYQALEQQYMLAHAAEGGSPAKAAALKRCRSIIAAWRRCMMARQQQGAVLSGAFSCLLSLHISAAFSPLFGTILVGRTLP